MALLERMWCSFKEDVALLEGILGSFEGDIGLF